MIPVLFQMECSYDEGTYKAYLYDEEHSAFPDEQEFLVGGIGW